MTACILSGVDLSSQAKVYRQRTACRLCTRAWAAVKYRAERPISALRRTPSSVDPVRR